jgi:hypothetical protein
MRRVAFVAVCFSMLAGCATTGEKVDVMIPTSTDSGTVNSGTGPRVLVKPFEDARMDRTHLGSRSHLWGNMSHFDLPKDTVGVAVAKALAQHLNKRGWQASVDGAGGATPDATITGTIQDLSVNAVSKFGHTELSAKNTMTVWVANHSDESTIQERLLGSGSDEVFWFEPEDAQQLVNEVLEKNIEKFLTDTKVEGKVVKLR